MTRVIAVHVALFAASVALVALAAAIAPATAHPHRGGLSFDCGRGLHEPVCSGRNCDCSCHG